jgi:hypothetical protein
MENLRLLVVDANAIIGGIKLEGIADCAVTIQEVFDEIRDKQSRQFLTTLPYKLQLSEPTEDSIKAGERVKEQQGIIYIFFTACMARYSYTFSAFRCAWLLSCVACSAAIAANLCCTPLLIFFASNALYQVAAIPLGS